MRKHRRFLVVGGGFSGAVLARALTDELDVDVDVIDQRDHIAGNCHTERDPETGVMVHRYGPHIFNTSREDVWRYVSEYGQLQPFTNRVKASLDEGVFSLPVNLHTINQFFGLRLSPQEARAFIAAKADNSIEEPSNFEEQAIKMMGRELYFAFFYGYTKKQWGCEPRELPHTILTRLPMRFDYNDNYYSSKYQGIPVAGYTDIVSNILDSNRIVFQHSTKFVRGAFASAYDHVFYTGPLDEYFGYDYGRLGYRTVTFKEFRGNSDRLGCAVINYPSVRVPYTRVHEHKHFAPWEQHEKTIWFEEYSKETAAGDVPFYPKRLTADMELFDKYKHHMLQETNISFLGRLGTYRYINMDHAIGEALDFAKSVVSAVRAGNDILRTPTGFLL